jgi:hypothetical protein
MVLFSIFINGYSSGFFSSLRGLSKGDPSPLFFVVSMEALSKMMSATVDSGHLSRFSTGSRNHEEMIVSHLLFVDDILIFCEHSCEQLSNLRCLFLCFEVVLGLKINLYKSEIVFP